MDWTRRVVVASGIAGIIGIVIIATVGIWIWQGGMLHVKVQETGPHGTDISINVPAAPVQAILAFVPDGIFEKDDEMTRAVPYLKNLHKDLAKLPNCVLVDVEDRGSKETVRIEKTGRNLVIDVHSPDEVVHVSVPIRFLGSVMKRLGSAPVRDGVERVCEPSA